MTQAEKQVLLKFGEKVRTLRKTKGLTQQTLAELADLEYKYIQRIEGENPPSIGLLKLRKLAEAFKINPSRLVDY